MKQRQDVKYLKKFGFKNRKAFEKAIKETTEDLEFVAQKIFKPFEEKVTEWESEYLKGRKKRFVAEISSPPQNKLLKSPERIAEKILESWNAHDQWSSHSGDRRGKKPVRHDPKNFSQTMTDLIRFRIVCNYLGDVRYVSKKLQHYAKKNKIIDIEKCDDFIEIPYPERRVGHRAVQCVFKYLEDKDKPVLFEVQVMTQLQHAWDKKDHHLIYEYVRVKQDGNIPPHLKNRMAAMSEVLYVADTVFDSLRKDILKIMGEK